MNIDNRDYELLNNYDINELINTIKYLNIKMNKNIKTDKDKLIKTILKYYYIDNIKNKLIKKQKNYNNIAKRFNLLKYAYIAGNDNNDNIYEINKLQKII